MSGTSTQLQLLTNSRQGGPVPNRKVRDRCYLRNCSLAAALASLLLAIGAPTILAQNGTLTGRVTDARSGVPITTAQVTISGTSLGAVVDADGRFRIVNVPPGS